MSIMSPTKSQPPSSGWAGDLETDIPASLFPKHVQGLHASGDAAFVREFDSFYQASTWKSKMFCKDGEHVAYSVDTWESPGGYTVMVPAGTLVDLAVWRHIWDTKVAILVTFLPAGMKDDLAMFSSSKFVGSYQIQLEAEKETENFVQRTLKVRNRGFLRTVTQIVFMASSVPPNTSSFLALIRESSQLSRLKDESGPIMVWSHQQFRDDLAIYWMCLDTMSRQMRTSGDVNLGHYCRYLAVTHQLQLSNCQLYIQLHDMLAWAIQHNNLDYEKVTIRYI